MRAISKLAIALATCTALLAPQAKAEVVKDESAESLINRNTPVYVWHDNAKKPRAVAIAIHGLVMHGGVYDALAKKLAADGMVVYAPDLRGFGRWKTRSAKESAMDYDESCKDVNELVKAASERYPNLPLYCIGESMGAGMAMRVAINNPGRVNGIVLSSPALTLRMFLKDTLTQAPGFLMAVHKKVDLTPYIRKYASEDPKIIAESLADPLVTKGMTGWEMVQSRRFMRPNLHNAKKLPSHIPMLVIQGDKDRVLKANAVVQLLARAKSKDQTVRWFSNTGHLLLETSYMRPDTVSTVTGWLHEHIEEAQPTQVTMSEAYGSAGAYSTRDLTGEFLSQVGQAD
jgi:alpha-beta hydrolase superfamily lysophospholipase